MAVAAFTVTPQTGDVYATDFLFTDQTAANAIGQVWSLGDGNFEYNTTSFTHSYNYPGTYTVTLTSFQSNGTIATTSKNVTVDYVYRDYVTFTQIPDKYADPGAITTVPFKIAVTTAQTDVPLVVNLFAANSNSIPYEFIPSKWNFLTPTWRFLDKNQNFITSLSVEPTKLYKNDKLVGLSGEGEFYFVDDTSTGDPTYYCPLLLAATLQTSAFNFPQDSNAYPYPSYSNSTVAQAVIVWQINDLKPSFLKVTGNYIDNIYPRKWTGVKIPILITGHSNRDNRVPGSGETDSNILFSYPETNQIGLSSEIVVSLSGVPSNYYTVDEAPLYFQSLTPDGFRTGGYIFTTITPLSPIDTTAVQVSGITYEEGNWDQEQFPYPSGFAPNPFVWISNPERGNLNKIFLIPFPQNCETINYYKQNGILIDGVIKTYDVPQLSTDNTFNYLMSGFAGIYGLAVDPRNYDLVATDNELDCIYKFSTFGELLCTVQLSSLGNYSPLSGAYTPGNVSIDQNYNIYVSLYNAVSVLKFNKDLVFTKMFAPTGNNNFFEFDSDFVVKPPVVETDRQNNVWTACTHPLCSLLIKYDSSGNVLKQIELPLYSSPISLAINLQNNVWVANSYNSTNSYGTVQLYDTTTSTLMSSITGFIRPDNLAMDRNNNVWLTHGIRNFGLITKEGQTYSWTVDTDGNVSTIGYPASLDVDELQENEELGGLGVDVYNRVWIIDSLSNMTHLFSADSTIVASKIRSVSIVPNSTLGFRLNDTNTYSYTVSSDYFQSAQASGDWTGNKWYQKYVNSTTLSATQVSGVSTPFTVYNFENNFQIQRNNENFDMAGYLKSLALPEIFSSNTVLFDQFFAAAVGTATPSAYEDLGQNVYERIANFVYNHADIDSCNIPQLISLATEAGVPASTYGVSFPAEIQKYLDIASVPKDRLWGVKSPLPLTAQSIGPQLNVQTSYISAGTKMFVRNKFDSSYTVVDVPLLNDSLSYYPLSAFGGYGLAQPVTLNYLFYAYNPVCSNNFIEGVIDWNNQYTTLNPYASTTEEWYGEQGAIENVFNYLLTKNLIVK